MKKLLRCLGIALLPIFLQAQSPSAKIDPDLLQRMVDAPDAYQEVIIELADQVDSRAMLQEFETSAVSLETRSYEVITRLQDKAAATQPAVLDRLRTLDGADAATIYAVWIVNAIYVKAKAGAIERMADWPEVGALVWDAPIEHEQPAAREPAGFTPNGSEPGLRAIKAPFMWNLGYTGYGRKALVIDTGDDPEHPALIDNFWGHQVPTDQAWNGTGYPEDCADHGTHVTGTVCGLDRKTNDTIGVAFNAQWMGGPMQFPVGEELGCNVAFSQTIFANTATMQWAINPDGNAGTISDRPDVINCSWRGNPFACGVSTAINTLNAVEAAGIAVVWAQGNNGPGASTVASGASMNMDLVNTFAVGAVNGANPNFPIADFSSRGPTPCGGNGALLVKPEVSAPGVSVRSSVPGGTYQSFDGTSMAAPHASGAIVLLKEAFPTVSGIQLKLALYNSAQDLGVVGEDNAYGRGMIDLEAAYNYLINNGNNPVPPVAADRDVVIIDLKVDGLCNGPVIPTVTFENASAQTITSLQFKYGIQGGQEFLYDWNGTMNPNSWTTVTLPGATGIMPGAHTFVVELVNPNGQPDPRPLNNRFKRSFTMADDEYPSASVSALQSVPLCNNSRVLLEYTESLEPQEIVQWFANTTSTNPIATGSTYLTPPLTANTTYYVSTANAYQTGKPAINTGGTTSNSIEGSLQFSVDQPFILRSVKVYADEVGGRLIRLLDNAGNQVAFKLVSISQVGEQRITLNFNIPAGSGYQLTVSSGKPLKHTSTQPGYPYQIPGVLNIYSGRSGAGINTLFIYYYFFDWEVEVPLVCNRRPVPVSVNTSPSAPVVSFTASSNTVYLSEGGTVTFTDQTPNVTARLWDFGNGQTSTEANPTATYTQTGTYTVRLLASTSNGCSNVTEGTITVLQTVSASEPGFQSERVMLFPNPAGDAITLGFLDQTPKDVDVQITDLLGRNTRILNGLGNPGELLPMDVSTLPAGIYLVQVRSEGRLYWSGKFVKN